MLQFVVKLMLVENWSAWHIHTLFGLSNMPERWVSSLQDIVCFDSADSLINMNMNSSNFCLDQLQEMETAFAHSRKVEHLSLFIAYQACLLL